jgi:hypothetical protein
MLIFAPAVTAGARRARRTKADKDSSTDKSKKPSPQKKKGPARVGRPA